MGEKCGACGKSIPFYVPVYGHPGPDGKIVLYHRHCRAEAI